MLIHIKRRLLRPIIEAEEAIKELEEDAEALHETLELCTLMAPYCRILPTAPVL